LRILDFGLRIENSKTRRSMKSDSIRNLKSIGG
jgi:hypothetical protein